MTTRNRQEKMNSTARTNIRNTGDVESQGNTSLFSRSTSVSMVELANTESLSLSNTDKSEVLPLTNKSRSSKEDSHHTSTSKVLSSCFLYMFCSVAMVLVNKSLASSYKSKTVGDGLNLLLVVFQAVVAVICVEVCKKLKIVDYPSFDINVAKQWAPVNLFFCAMLFTGMASLQHNTVPIVTVFKNISNIVTAIGELTFFGTKIECLVVLAFAVMLGGAVAATSNDAQTSPIGLFWMAANCLSTSGYVLYMKHATQTVKLPKFGMVFYNNLLCTCFLLPAAMVAGEVNIFILSTKIHTFEYFIKNFFAGFVGFFLNFASLNCVAATGPTTYAIIGSLNKIPTAFLGFSLFDEVITPETWSFISVAMCGGFLYSYAKIRSSRRK